MLFRKIICLPFFLVCGLSLFAQEKSIQAIKIFQAPKIDGRLDDPAWTNSVTTTDFTQNYPSTGKPASQPTNVKVIYDNTAIYIGAYLYDDPALIRKQITAGMPKCKKM